MDHSHKTSTCPDCALGAFARNHYFTGKLLVERDFSDEQRFHIDKLRLHHQRLHGWGVVCGLKVKQHPDPACRDRYVVVEPGTAIDCCGHEILVREEVRFPFAQTPAVHALGKANDTGPHTLQICIRYKECPTEEIPVLFDECGCDETRCAPNRILESYELDVLVDPPQTGEDPHGVSLQWKHTILLAHSKRLALHENLLYVMNSDTPGVIYVVSIDNDTVVGAHNLLAQGLALAVSNNGERLYAAVQGTVPNSDPPQVLVLDTSKLGQVDATIQTLTVEDTAGSDVLLTVAPSPDDRLFALFASASSQIAVWDTDINNPSPPPPADPQKVFAQPLNSRLRDLVFSTDGARAYSADAASHNVRSIDAAATPPVAPTDVLIEDPAPGSPPPDPSAPSALAVANSTAGDMLVVGDDTNSKLYFVPLANPVVSHVVQLTHHPIALVASPGANWIYVLERDEAAPEHFFVEPVSVQRVLLDLQDPRGALVPVGENATQLLLSESGRTLYVAYEGDSGDTGGVAILDVAGQDCEELLWKSLEGCPSCDTGNCVVLATIKDYHLDDKLADSPADPANDADNNIVRIDNRTGRRLLPSTQVLTEAVKCLLEHPGTGGGKGEQGHPGNKGDKGDEGDKGDKGDPGDKGDKGDTGESGTGLNFGLPHIVAINWPHNGDVKIGTPLADTIADLGLIVAFDKGMLPETIRDSDLLKPGNQKGIPVFEVFRRQKESQEEYTRCFCSVDGEVLAERAITTTTVEDTDLPKCGDSIVNTRELKPDEYATSARFAIKPPSRPSLPLVEGDYRVVIRGDFILGATEVTLANGRFDHPALDANHLGPGLLWDPDKRRCPTGDGVEGGTFESWFTIVE